VWLAQLALPLLGLWLLRANPALDTHLEHHAGHFWIVVATALVSVLLGVWVSEAARRRSDARLLLVSLAFLSSAGFLLLHALATPAVLLPGRNTGFIVATPVGLFLGAWFALASSADLTRKGAAAVLRYQWLLRGGLALVMAAWAALSLLALPPFDTPLAEDAGQQLVRGLAVVGVALYAIAAVRYAKVLWRRRVMLGIVTSYVLLAEAMVAIAFAHNWQLSWWEWHLLLATAFAVVAWSARDEARREGTPDHVFDGLALDATVRRIDQQYENAVRTLVAEMRRDKAGEQPVGELVRRVARRFDLGRGQVGVLGRAAGEIAELLAEQAAEAASREQMEQELRLAQLIQQRLLPDGLPPVPGWRVDTWYRPARDVGGDFYDLIKLPEGQIGIVVGDVSGKGVPSALVMASTHALLRAEAPRLVAPSTVLGRVNELLLAETPATMFVTCVYAVLDPTTGRLRWANAGQDLPLLRGGTEVTQLRATGMPLGLMPGMRYEEKVTLVPRGSGLLFHSDGITEAHGPGREMFGSHRIAALAARRLDGEALIRQLLDELHRFTGPGWEQEDDITLVALERSAAGIDAGRPAEPGRLAEATAEARLTPIRRERPATAVAEALTGAAERGGGDVDPAAPTGARTGIPPKNPMGGLRGGAVLGLPPGSIKSACRGGGGGGARPARRGRPGSAPRGRR
jgi:serine phosphatase RsbU (regulator of sigma subunit)